MPVAKDSEKVASPTSPDGGADGGGVFAVPLTVDGIDSNNPDDPVPLYILLNGTIARVPRWEHYSTTPERRDRLIVTWEQDGAKTVIFDQSYPGPITQKEFEIPITPQRLGTDGVALLYYEVRDADQNPDPASAPVKLIIDHSQVPVERLKEALFPHATMYGYLNCNTVPKLYLGVTVKVPPQTVGKSGDICKLQWQGYRELNGVDPIDNTFIELTKELMDADIRNGFDMVFPFRPCVHLLIDKDSALVVYRFYRGNVLFAESEPALVKIDRVRSGETLPCYYEH